MVAYRENADHVRRTVKERGYIGRVLLDESGDTTGRTYGVFGPPTFYMIDREGRLIGRAVGGHDWESAGARRLIQTLVETPPAR